MKKVIKSLVIWRIASTCYFLLLLISILPIAILLQLLLDGVHIFEKSMIASTVSLVSSSLFFLIFTMYFRAFLIRKSSSKTLRNPCKIELNLHKEDEIVDLLSMKMRIKHIEKNVWYGKENLKRSLRVFAFSFCEDELNNDLSIAERYVKRINEKTHFPSIIDKDMHQKMGRVQLFLYNEVPQTVLNSAARNVEDNIEQSEFLVNIFINLTEGAVYIPFCCSRLLGVGRLYQYAINRVSAWLNIENDKLVPRR